MYEDRIQYYRQLEEKLDSNLMVYVTGDRQGLETKIGSDVLDFFVHHLDQIGPVKKITLFLYTMGGVTSAAWSIANLIRQFCDDFEVIVPSKALSAGTLICLGAKKIIMTKQATLGSIDPSVNHPLNPLHPLQEKAPGPLPPIPVSVEDIEGYIEQAKKILGNEADLMQVFLLLAQKVHPLVLGNAFRARAQIRMLGKSLISNHLEDETAISKILDFLCSESGSHDYTINRREAKNNLGLPVEKPSQEVYEIIKKIYDDISIELKLTEPFNLNLILKTSSQAHYQEHRALIESLSGGSHVFISEGVLLRKTIDTPLGQQTGIDDQRIRDEWEFSLKEGEKS